MYSITFLSEGSLYRMIRYKCGSYFLQKYGSGMKKFTAKELKIKYPDSFQKLRSEASLRKYGDY